MGLGASRGIWLPTRDLCGDWLETWISPIIGIYFPIPIGQETDVRGNPRAEGLHRLTEQLSSIGVPRKVLLFSSIGEAEYYACESCCLSVGHGSISA